jgi:hypothetical protein
MMKTIKRERREAGDDSVMQCRLGADTGTICGCVDVWMCGCVNMWMCV